MNFVLFKFFKLFQNKTVTEENIAFFWKFIFQILRRIIRKNFYTTN